MKNLILIIALILFLSCTPQYETRIRLVNFNGEKIDWSSPAPKQITIVDILKKKGISLELISHIILLGDESSYTSGTKVEIKNKEEIKWLWTQIFEHAEPYAFWVSSGNRRMNIYIKGKSTVAAKLFINETDSTGINDVDGRFMCHGLEEYIMKKLENKKDSSNSDSAVAKPE
jgi:hypothetical protein